MRVLVLTLLVCAIAPAWAQTGAGTESTTRDRVSRQIEERDQFEGLLRRVPATVQLTEEEKGVQAVIGGRDQAAAMWWSIRAKTALPAPCTSVAAVVDDADKFVAALNAWPAGRLGACAYAAAVMAMIQSEAESPALASAYGLKGSIKVNWVPAQGRADVDDALVLAMGAAPTAADDRDATLAKQAYSKRLRQVIDRALKRYDKPAGIAADWQAQFAVNGSR